MYKETGTCSLSVFFFYRTGTGSVATSFKKTVLTGLTSNFYLLYSSGDNKSEFFASHTQYNLQTEALAFIALDVC